MIIPSIDIQQGEAVQLVGGRELELRAGEPLEIAAQWSVVGELAVIDLDAAMGTGDNRELVRELVKRYRCRVGGGIRSLESALDWLDRGAEKVIVGTAATPELLWHLPPERVMVALDAVDGEVVVEGWQKATGESQEARLRTLKDLAGSFLVTFVEREGRLGGTDLEAAERLVGIAGKGRVTIAGGISTVAEIAALDRLGADAQVGMALYKGEIDLTEAFAAPLTSDRPDGLWPTVVCDPSGVALGLAYSNLESLRRALSERRGVYQSRSRGLWTKGEISGSTQELIGVDLDCDRDTLRFTVRQSPPGFCHRETSTCWGQTRGLAGLERRLLQRSEDPPAGSYVAKLLSDATLLSRKLSEEAAELATAESTEEVTWEAADLLFFTLVAMQRAGIKLEAVARQLDRRALRVRRRSQSESPTEESRP
jgi:phosphoribosyl-ATP pyrophosphohydrolase/phosphoribosyl-AMP cyclohydrolase